MREGSSRPSQVSCRWSSAATRALTSWARPGRHGGAGGGPHDVCAHGCGRPRRPCTGEASSPAGVPRPEDPRGLRPAVFSPQNLHRPRADLREQRRRLTGLRHSLLPLPRIVVQAGALLQGVGDGVAGLHNAGAPAGRAVRRLVTPLQQVAQETLECDGQRHAAHACPRGRSPRPAARCPGGSKSLACKAAACSCVQASTSVSYVARVIDMPAANSLIQQLRHRPRAHVGDFRERRHDQQHGATADVTEASGR